MAYVPKRAYLPRGSAAALRDVTRGDYVKNVSSLGRLWENPNYVAANRAGLTEVTSVYRSVYAGAIGGLGAVDAASVASSVLRAVIAVGARALLPLGATIVAGELADGAVQEIKEGIWGIPKPWRINSKGEWQLPATVDHIFPADAEPSREWINAASNLWTTVYYPTVPDYSVAWYLWDQYAWFGSWYHYEFKTWYGGLSDAPARILPLADPVPARAPRARSRQRVIPSIAPAAVAVDLNRGRATRDPDGGKGPPGKRKERKYSFAAGSGAAAVVHQFLGHVYGSYTEWGEQIDIFYQAAGGKRGRWVSRADKFQFIVDHYHDIDWRMWAKLELDNFVEDYTFGKFGQLSKKMMQALHIQKGLNPGGYYGQAEFPTF